MARVGNVKVNLSVGVDPDTVQRLRLINQQAKRVERAAKILKQQSAQLIESMVDNSTAEEAHDAGDSRNH